MRSKTVKARDIHARHMKSSPAYRKAYDARWSEFALVDALIQARTRARLSQAEVASRMGTTESAVSRLESGRVKPSTRPLERYATGIWSGLREPKSDRTVERLAQAFDQASRFHTRFGFVGNPFDQAIAG
jgi:transcriptional regulator with XRE-family HTH domain